MNANPVTGIAYVSDLSLTKGNIYFNRATIIDHKIDLLCKYSKWINIAIISLIFYSIIVE